MSWKATLDGHQVKRLKAALTCFNKIGSELLIEALLNKLILRSLNSSRSAFAAITFHKPFFEAHNVFESRDVKGSVLIKHALAIFRTQAIQKLELELDVKEREQLIATVSSEAGLQKEYRIPCIDSEILQATVDRESLPTYVIASAKELHRLLSSFQANLEEITVIALPETMHDGRTANAIQLHSYLDPSRRQADASLHTQISVNTDAVFTSFRHTGDEAADVTFNLRDFRVMLNWCMTMDMEIAIRFQTPGAPLLVEPHCAHGDVDVEAQLVLATLLESQAEKLQSKKPPKTGIATGIRGYFRTPGTGATPHIPDPAGATGQQGPVGGQQKRGLSRFATEKNRQPRFDSPAHPQVIPEASEPPRWRQQDGGAAPRNAPAPAFAAADPQAPSQPDLRQHPSAHAPEDERLNGVKLEDQQNGHLEEPNEHPAKFFGQEDQGHAGGESFEEDDQEDDGPTRWRSRYDPRGLADDDDENEDDDENAIPGTP